jgi:cytochrome bd ubiquinol oxidase subunit I
MVTRQVFHKEPAKFAAVEALAQTGDHLPEMLGGVLVDGQVRYGIRIPNAVSLLAGFRQSTRIQGLDAVPPAVRPSDRLVSIVHLSFDLMVGTSFLLLGLAVWFGLAWRRRRDLSRSRWFLRCAVVSGLVALFALEAGWVVTEVGRQRGMSSGCCSPGTRSPPRVTSGRSSRRSSSSMPASAPAPCWCCG